MSTTAPRHRVLSGRVSRVDAAYPPAQGTQASRRFRILRRLLGFAHAWLCFLAMGPSAAVAQDLSESTAPEWAAGRTRFWPSPAIDSPSRGERRPTTVSSRAGQGLLAELWRDGGLEDAAAAVERKSVPFDLAGCLQTQMCVVDSSCAYAVLSWRCAWQLCGLSAL
jgi:hypothetical protein